MCILQSSSNDTKYSRIWCTLWLLSGRSHVSTASLLLISTVPHKIWSLKKCTIPIFLGAYFIYFLICRVVKRRQLWWADYWNWGTSNIIEKIWWKISVQSQTTNSFCTLPAWALFSIPHVSLRLFCHKCERIIFSSSSAKRSLTYYTQNSKGYK